MTQTASSSTPSGLRVHVAERTDALVDALADVLAATPADPFTPDVVAVPTRGVERWVAQRLSHRLGTGDGTDGICANVQFPSPHRLIGDALSTTSDEDPWGSEQLAWHVLAAIDAHHGADWLRTVSRYLGDNEDEVRRGRRFRLAQRVARLFGAYDVQRPQMVRAWARGDDEDGVGEPLPGDLRWQPQLWREVRDAAGVPSPAERLEGAVARLREDPSSVDLPPRLSVFGATALPAGHLQVLDALAEHREVHLWLPQPSLALWHGLSPSGPARRSEATTPATHPLLASMAGDATELATRVLGLGPDVAVLGSPRRGRTVLGALQERISQDRTDGPRLDATTADRSVQVHACHGRSRQVEVLREVVVGLLADDDTLEPRDIIVMCPDVEAFAPLVEAAFGPTAGIDEGAPEHPGRTLRVRIADRAPRSANPVLAVVATLLELAESRVGASAVVDLAGQAPVRRRFGFDDEELDRVRAWALESGVRWGEDVSRRERYGMGALRQGTWSTALDRLLLGVAMAEEDQRFVGTVLPVDDVGSSDVDLVGRLAEFVDRLTATLSELDGARPAAEWFASLDRAVRLLTDVAPADRWQQAEAARAIDAVRNATSATLRLADVVALLEPHLAGRPTRANFRTGALTVCSLAPMRAVPHRVVALLGMDDGAFPRGSGRDGDDILARDPLVGERDARQEDRQLFLDAVTSAQENLVVVYSGADERTGAARPPAVPVGELLDAIDAAATFPGGRSARDQVVHHPLQTVDERNFEPGRLGRDGPFSFDVLDLTAALTRRRDDPPETSAPLEPPHTDELDLEDLASTLEHPVRAFVRMRLGATLPGDEPQLDDRLPLELGGLERWAVGDRLLQAALDGIDLDDAAAAERRRGHMPPATLGGATLQQVRGQVEPLLAASARYLVEPATSVDVTIPLDDGRVLTGTINGVRGDVLVRTVFSRLGAKHRLRAWVQLLALAAAFPERTFEAVTIGRGQVRSSRVARLTTPAEPRATLQRLVGIYDEAMCGALPLPLATSLAYAHPRTGGGDESDALGSARAELGTADDAAAGRGGFEAVDDYHLLAFGDPVTFDRLIVEGHTGPESTRFGALSMALWSDLIAHEEVG
ncbi:exodeoxyribonuclease V subunit gamma [Cellulomonas xylanilytica]|uniref:exodeoxyribonuclease V subunit gamma n=1 Tax=Cellulomonas xylanilytica TaxID=233583 RepID=UPI001FEAEBCD|nr:exodeoxyribonuclease V subunit gamma [Cellulomonas xylanilytica]